ncbi:MAG: radical SAM protein [Planctomycetota bacterium]|nr:radical SAM protein [Planctomycetota bacterium]
MSNEARRKIVFGPVPSRRLGMSLGVDLVPFKTCGYSCIYCQLGITPSPTLERREYVPPREAIEAVRAALSGGLKPDYITLSGSGEPTLHSRIGDVIHGLKDLGAAPVAVLTSGALLWMPEVRRDLAEADVVLPTLAAGDETVFRRMHCPAQGLDFRRVVEGMEAFRREYCGQIWLEVFLVAGLNTTEDQIEKMCRMAERIAPDKVQLNTAVRPPAEKGVTAPTMAELEQIRAAFGPAAEIIAEFGGRKTQTPGGKEADPGSGEEAASPDGRNGGRGNGAPAGGEDMPRGWKEPDTAGRPPREAGAAVARLADEILAIVSRHPCTPEDVAAVLGLAPADAGRILDGLRREGLLEEDRRGGRSYFRTLQS